MSPWDYLFGSKPKKRKKGAKKAPKKAAKKRSKKMPRAFKAQQLFMQRAGYLNRDIKAGTLTHSDITEAIKADWDKDSDEYADAYGVKSFAQFDKGVRAFIK